MTAGWCATCDNYRSATDSNADVQWDSGWYVVDADTEIDGTVVIDGDVRLILCDGAGLDVSDGICAVDGASLSIYAGKLVGESPSALPAVTGSGRLWAMAETNGKAGISCDDVVIHGGTVYSVGCDGGAGIGGDRGKDGGRFTMYGGSVESGRYSIEISSNGGAGVGGGAGGNGGDITVYGGSLEAYGDPSGGAGIGGGAGGNGGNITVYGGKIEADPNFGSGAGIGGGVGGNGGNITIYGGTVDAYTFTGAASIGGGVGGGSGHIAIYGGTTYGGTMLWALGVGTGVGFGAGEGSAEPEDVTIGEGVTLYVYDEENGDFVPVEDPLTRVPDMQAKGGTHVLPETAVLTYFGNDSDDGAPPDTKSYSPGTAVAVSDNAGGLVRDGYVFSGWRAQPDCGKIYQVGDPLVVSGDTDLYALWKAVPPESLTAAQKPTGVTGLCAIGSLLGLVRDPVKIPEGYTMQYSLDGENWSNTASARDEGEYIVRVRYVADENHIDFDGEDIIVTIGEPQNPIVLRDAATGVELAIDNSNGSPMRRTLNNAAALEGVTETVDSVTGHKTTVTTAVDVELVVADKSGEAEGALGASTDEEAPIQAARVELAYEIHLERVTRTTTAVTDEHGNPVGDPMTAVSARETLSLEDSLMMVSVPYAATDYDTNLVYTVYHARRDADGWKYENMRAVYNEEIGAFTFFTVHNSTYFIYSEPFAEADVTTDFQVALRPTGTDGRAFDIILSTDSGVINRFSSAELTFKLTPGVGQLAYDVVANHADCVKMNDSLKEAHCFAFYVNGEKLGKEMSDITARSVTLGTVRFDGYGADWSFEIKSAVIHTAEFYENVVVKTEGAASPTDADALVYTGAGTTAAAPTAKIDPLTVSPDTRNLTVYVTFPNPVADHVSAYQDMTLTVSGGSLSRDIVVKLGGDALLNQESAAGGMTENVAADIVPGAYPYGQSAAITSAYTAAGTHHYFTTADTPLTADMYTVTLNRILMLDTQYTVTLSGAGYRTVRYNVFMDKDKTLTFWNNVMDAATVVESGKGDSAVRVNYLAGDIVQDAQINIYDLSAAVSYFGSANAVDAASPSVRYDLNRDGKIDSIDVAYVLVSWGK